MRDFIALVVPAIVVPLGAFILNWAMRNRNGYPQTAAADLLLALMIFDGTVITASEAFAPYVNDAEMRAVIVPAHFAWGALAFTIWWAVMAWGEPALANYYRLRNPATNLNFPYLQFGSSWTALMVVYGIHIGFFLV